MTNTETEIVVGTETQIEPIESVIKVPIFLAFAEYFGYVSPFMPWITKLCEGKDVPKYMKNILYTEALSIYHEMVAEIGKSKMSELYDQYYLLILHEYDENLLFFDDYNTNDLPF